jgi:hypothetical protein
MNKLNLKCFQVNAQTHAVYSLIKMNLDQK